MQSHRAVLKLAIEKKHSSILILEDDIIFCDNFKNELKKCLNELPDDWDALHLNGTDHPLQKASYYSPNLLKVSYTTGAFGVLINSSIFQNLLDCSKDEDKENDVYFAEIQNRLNWFKCAKKLVLHPPNYSEINGIFVNYKHLYEAN